MSASRLSYHILGVASFFLLWSAPFAHAQDKKQQAREHYEAGARKFDIGKYDEAAAEFQAAYEIVGDPVLLYNIASSYQLAQNAERALFFYTSYLRTNATAPNRPEAQQRVH